MINNDRMYAHFDGDFVVFLLECDLNSSESSRRVLECFLSSKFFKSQSKRAKRKVPKNGVSYYCFPRVE